MPASIVSVWTLLARATPVRGAMTALDRYAKLEAVARYSDGRSAPREVVVSFGERSLIIMGLDDKPIAHWPLASLRALGPPAQQPVEIVPDPGSDERLLLDDREMSDAIREVCPDLHRMPTAPRRRVPWAALLAGLAVAGAAVGALALWPLMPDSLADLVPPEREAALGDAVAARVPALLDASRPPALCVSDEGQAALRALADRLAPDADAARPLRISVLDHPSAEALALPGGRVLLFHGLIQAAATPEEIAGVLAHALGHVEARDPLRATLDRAGATALAGVLVGDITGKSVLKEAAAALDASYAAASEAQADAVGFAVLAAAGLPATAGAQLAERLAADEARYIARHPWTTERARAALAADTVGSDPFTPALRDRDWIALGNICDRTRPVEQGGF